MALIAISFNGMYASTTSAPTKRKTIRRLRLTRTLHISDKDEILGQPVVTNGLLLSKIHHTAFDAHLTGIDPNYKVHVAERLLEQRGGPTLQALKQL